MKKWLGFALKVGVSVGVLALIATRSDVGKIGALLTSLNSSTIAAVMALTVVQVVIGAYRWVLVMQGVEIAVAFWPALQALYVSLFWNQCLPSYIGADAYRVYWLYRENHPLAPAARGVVIDRVVAIIVLVLMLGAGLPFLFVRLPAPAVQSGITMVLLGGLAGTAVFFGGDLLPKRWQRPRLVGELALLSATARHVLLTDRTGAAVAGLAVLIHLITALVMFCFSRSLGLPLTLLDCLLFTPPIMLLSAVPISIAGWGVREGVVVGALSMIGVGTEPALALSVLMGFTMLANALIGVLPLAFGGRRYLAVREQYAGGAVVGERVL
jgi:uncharacterized membrane protein YbhN (UPF0104 family)